MTTSSTQSVPAKIVNAIKQDDLNQLEQLIRDNPEQLHFKMPVGNQTWLGYAAGYGSVPVVRKLLSLGFDVNEGSAPDDLKPLSSACYENRLNVAQILLDAGSALASATSAQNPLFAAIVGRSPEIVKLLLEHGMDATVRYNSPTMRNMDAVAFALMQGAADCARVIALWNAGGNEIAAQQALDEGNRVANENVYRKR